jgi:hypothetical protein
LRDFRIMDGGIACTRPRRELSGLTRRCAHREAGSLSTSTAPSTAQNLR